MKTFHVWFSTKRRKYVLENEIRAVVLDTFTLVADSIGVTILAKEARGDHVHLLLQLLDDQFLSKVMHDLKGRASRETFLAVPELKWDMVTGSLWQRSYGFRPVPSDQIRAVKHYIETQDERPLRSALK